MDSRTKAQAIKSMLEQEKTSDILVMDVHKLSCMLSHMIICTCTSPAHLRGLTETLVTYSKSIGEKTICHDNPETGWMLVDLGDCIVHLMTQAMRDHYELEKLWQVADSLTE